MLATASSIVIAGGTPVPVDIGADNLIDPGAVASAIGPRTVGVMPTQLNGRTCDMTPIVDLVQRHGLALIEDSAQALGSCFDGQHAGTFGLAGVFSFFPAKVLGSLGDGGAVVTNSAKTADKVYQLHDHGRDQAGEQVGWGRNSRLDNLQAAFLSHRLDGYGDVIARRREVAAAYQEQLGDVEQLQLPPAPTDGPHFDVYQNYELQADSRDDLRQHLRSCGIGTLVQWGGKAIHQWEELGFSCTLPRVERFFERCIMLPMNTFISNDDVDYICDSVKSFYSSGGPSR
jgi:dTDP-4-amino-4,6-dideoxygalactose transaminase